MPTRNVTDTIARVYRDKAWVDVPASEVKEGEVFALFPGSFSFYKARQTFMRVEDISIQNESEEEMEEIRRYPFRDQRPTYRKGKRDTYYIVCELHEVVPV